MYAHVSFVPLSSAPTAATKYHFVPQLGSPSVLSTYVHELTSLSFISGKKKTAEKKEESEWGETSRNPLVTRAFVVVVFFSLIAFGWIRSVH